MKVSEIKLDNNWRNSTIERLQKDEWPPYSGSLETFLIKRIHALRKKALNDFTIEDLRIMIGQNEGLDYLVPLAIEVLTEDLFAEGDFYEGDLLKSVLDINTDFWVENRDYWEAVDSLIKVATDELAEQKISTVEFCKNRP